MYMYVYVYMSIYVYIYIYVYMYIWKDIYVHIYIRAWLLMRSIHIRIHSKSIEVFLYIDSSMHSNPLPSKFALNMFSKFRVRSFLLFLIYYGSICVLH